MVDWLGHADCADCAEGRNGVCRDLPLVRRDGVSAPIDRLTYSAKMPIYGEGDAAHYVYAVREGLLKLSQVAGNGTPRIVRFLRPGQLAGMEALAGEPYRHTVETLLPTQLCRIPVTALEEGPARETVLSPRLFRHWLRAMDDADAVIAQLSTGAAQGRVARFMLYVLSEAGEDSCVALSRDDMSALLSVTMETVSRTVADFKRQGWVQEHGGRFHFDRQGLTPIGAQ